jgi:hypothetical protein
MKKESVRAKRKRQKPRLPEEGQKRIRRGGAHKNKKKREKNRANVRDTPDVFCSFHTFL